MAGVCCVANCDGNARRRGMCDIHYQRWREATPKELRPRPTPEERFWSRVDRRGPDECWPWTGGLTDRGYGLVTVDRKRVGAHRFSSQLAYGVTPDQVDHTCHNGSGCTAGNSCQHRRCCNPAHLENTTNLENSLRGESLAARHARKTHCHNGHAFTPENTYLYVYKGSRPRRYCKQCGRDRREAEKLKRKAA